MISMKEYGYFSKKSYQESMLYTSGGTLLPVYDRL